MKGIYSSPLRVYLCLAVLAAVGLYVASLLPISLFPNSSKPVVNVSVGYGGGTAREFLATYGTGFEYYLQSMNAEGIEVDKFTADYGNGSASYRIEFKWGVSAEKAQREVEISVQSYASRFPKEIRDSTHVNGDGGNSGFFAASFYSETRSLDDLYNVLEPLLAPKLNRIKDASDPELYNPNAKEVQVELIPEKLASLKIYPHAIESALEAALAGYSGGSLTQGTRSLQIQIPSQMTGLDALGRLPIESANGNVHLSDIARIDFGPVSTGNRSFKTNGAPSLILFARPKPGGNVKRMSEELITAIESARPGFPGDVRYRVLVDPSEFIRSSIRNVFHEVAIGAFLAVVILLVFIGSFRNVVTAAIEIPLSMILAFILMKVSGMHLNLISLGGLALSAGMNVDASVVVMENIFRHFEREKGPLGFARRLEVLVTAVKEVRLAVISSTVASLVVFLPLIFTSNLSSAILGDLAKTVVFSHGLSAVVALILVPTVRLHLMSREGARYEHPKPFAEKWIRALENGYARALSAFLDRALLRAGVYACVIAMLAGAATLVLPRLPKEIIGKPDTDWVTLGMWTRGNTFIRQMESHAEETEARFLEKFGDDIDYTFTQVYAANGAWMMARLKDKRRMREVKAAVSEEFQNTPFVEFWVDVWNPAELPIPDPPQLQIAARGGTPESRKHALEYIDDRLRREFPDNWVSINPGIGRTDIIQLSPLPETLGRLARERGMSLYKLADLLRVATEGRSIGYIPVEGRSTAVVLRFPKANGTEIRSAEEVAALPIAIDSKIVPLKAIAAVDLVAAPTNIRRESGKEVSQLTSRSSEEKRVETAVILGKAEEIIADWKAAQKASGTGSPDLTLQIEDAEKDLTDAIRQLSIATALSIALIFLTLLLQFGSFVNAALILVAIPLGFLGVLLSLYAFGSTLSLNSILGVILLNGIAVANSILLVDFTQRLVEQGMAPRAAAIAAARQRLRPILITSLTTILGMMPIALGFGEGGRILQPLGIAVSGGLWLSMTLTLFIVPALHVYALDFGLRPRREPGTSAALAPLGADPVT